MHTPVAFVFSDDERQQALKEGKRRQQVNETKKLRGRNGGASIGSKALEIHLLGAAGEMAVASYLNLKNFLYLDNKALNFNPKKAPNSQELPNIVKLNFAVNILSKKLMFKKKSVIGDNPYFFKLDQIEGLDIDTLFDFEFAEYLYKKLF
jgi:hypothetical protein